MSEQKENKKRVNYSAAWSEARKLVVEHRWRLMLGGVLMIFNRLVGLVLPASTKFLIDDVVGKQRADLLAPIALAAGAATFLQAVTSFSLAQVLGVAANENVARSEQ